MGFDLNELRTDKSAEEDGVWVDYLDGSKIKVARLGNQKYKSFIAQQYKRNRMTIDRGGEAAERVADRIQIEGLAKFVLLDLEGFEMGSKPVKYKPDLGIEILTNLPDFRADVEGFANDVNLFRQSLHEEDVEAVKKQ